MIPSVVLAKNLNVPDWARFLIWHWPPGQPLLRLPGDQLKLSLPRHHGQSRPYFVPAGPFAAPDPIIPAVDVAPVPPGRGAGRGAGRGPAQPAVAVPAYCRVQMILKPSSDSLIEAAMFLPAENWNGKLRCGVGISGWAGTVSYPQMAAACARAYATACPMTPGTEPTTMGRRAGMFGLDHLEKITDFAHRAMHELPRRRS